MRILRVACGGHTLTLGAGGELYAWGNGKHGQLGHGTLAHLTLPTPLDALRGKRLLFAACGSAHNILLTLDDGASPGYESATTADSFY